MLSHQKNFEDFYNELRDGFEKLKDLETWNEYDWSVNGYEHSSIMTELSREMMTWVEEGRSDEAQRLMNIVERYFHEGNLVVISIIYTDFLVNIIESKTEPREAVKGMMGFKTKNNYKRLLGFYRESD